MSGADKNMPGSENSAFRPGRTKRADVSIWRSKYKKEIRHFVT